ncbi:MAG: STAS domain-containing protein [Leptolyngbya sp. SIO4C1]|nr:STAS domain-containing protein [Leptolyngbya sp. SIO4C1]
MNVGVRIIEPTGILDGLKGDQLRQQVDAAIAANIQILLIDLSNITFVDSSGLGALVSVLKKTRAASCEMYVCSVNDQVRMLFELTSMDQVFNILPSRAQFETQVLPSAS